MTFDGSPMPPAAVDSAYRWMEPVPDWPVRREGDVVVFFRETALPACCVRCAAPATRSVRKTFTWHTPWLYLALLANALVYVLLALAVRKTARVDLPYCEACWRSRSRAIALAWGLTAGPVALAVVLGSALTGDTAALAVVGAIPVGWIAALAVVVVGVRTPRAHFIDERFVKLRGFGDAFLARTPPL